MNPKVTHMKRICGINSKKKPRASLKKYALHPLKIIPKLIYVTPIMTASFIFKELNTANSFDATYHFGSTPKG